jgi:small conductance mechanosensitive channel
MENITAWISENGVDWGIKIAVAIAIFIIGKIIVRIIANILQAALRKGNTDEMLVKFLGNITYGILLVAVVLAAVDTLGVNVTSLMAILGAAGGDFINAGGAAGVVDEIGLFATLMHTGDNQRIIVPNSAILGGNITNVSALETRRVDLVFGIGYEDNIGQARDIIMAVMEADERILKDPAPAVAVGELADSSVNLNVRPWVNSGDYWPVRADLLENIKVKFDEAGISIPYPQQDVYMHEVKAVG